MAKAKKLPSGSWRIRIGDGESGKTKSFTAPTKKEAEIMAAEYLSGKHRPTSEMLLGAAVDSYIESRCNLLSPSTIQGYQVIRRNYIQPLAFRRLCDISTNDLQSFVNEMAAKYSRKTVYNCMGLISSVYKVYCHGTDTNVKLPPKKREIKQFPAPQQIISAFRETDIEIPVLLAMWLGMRMSEIRGAKKSDISESTLLICRTVLDVSGEHIERDNTKTYNSTRSLRLPGYILQLIDALPPEQEYLTTYTHSQIYKRFIAGLEKNNLPRIRFHDLRHLNASLMLSLGIPDKIAMERGGWSTPDVMKGVYQHTFSEDRKKMDDLIDNFFSAMIDG